MRNNFICAYILLNLILLGGCSHHLKFDDCTVITSLVIDKEQIITPSEITCLHQSGTTYKVPWYSNDWSYVGSDSQWVYEVVAKVPDAPISIVDFESTGTISGRHKAGQPVKVKVRGCFNYDTEMIFPCDVQGPIVARQYDRRQIWGTMYQLKIYTRTAYTIKTRTQAVTPAIIPEGCVFSREDSGWSYYSTFVYYHHSSQKFQAAVVGVSAFYLNSEQDNPYDSIDELIESEFRSRFDNLIKSQLKSFFIR